MSWKKFYNQFSIIIYLSFLFFWFKDNLPPLREINFNRHVFLLLLIIIGTHKFLVCLKRKPNIFQAAKPNSQTILALSFLALLLIISRLPWLLYYQGLFSSDDAIPALMAKHISEGKTPPICFYGQLYIGSLPSHVMAIFFRIFGYSPLLFQLVTLSFYYSFVVVNFFLLKKLFSFSFAIIVSIFYCLPIGVLKEVSFDNTLVAPFWLFLGTSLIVLAYLIAFENKYHLAHFLGFLMGLSFWTHPITIYFILTSLFILTVKSKFIFKRYGVIGLYFFLGFFPMIMQEIYYKFHLIKFLTAGDKYLNLIKVDQTAKMISRLFLPSGQLFLAIFLILICLGIIILIKRAIEKKQFFSQEAILPFFFFVFLSIYLFSGHSSRYLIRYLYPLIFCLPPLLLSGIHIIKKSKILFTLLGIILIACFLSANITGYITFLKKVKENHLHYTELIASLKNTGKKYWIADYWIAYLVTALTGEKIVVDSWPVNRYYPYRLFKYNWETTENFIFSLNEETQRLQYQSLLKLIQALGINFRQKEIDGYGLIYDLEGTLYPQIYYGPVPEKIPDLILSEILETQDEIILNFNNRVKGEDIVFKLVINLADTVHGWKYFSLADDKVSIKLPKPSKADLTGHYHLEYMGLKISPSLKTFSFRETSALEGKNKSEFIFLKGFGPIIELQKKKKRLLEKEVKLAIRRQIKADECLKIYLSSPFEFSHLHWYGKFSQEVDLYLNEKKIFSQEISNEPTLIKLGADYLKDLNYNPIITMKFKYHSAFSFAPFWKVAAFLEKIVIESSQPKS